MCLFGERTSTLVWDRVAWSQQEQIWIWFLIGANLQGWFGEKISPHLCRRSWEKSYFFSMEKKSWDSSSLVVVLALFGNSWRSRPNINYTGSKLKKLSGRHINKNGGSSLKWSAWRSEISCCGVRTPYKLRHCRSSCVQPRKAPRVLVASRAAVRCGVVWCGVVCY
jgi:hypothetical protein